MLLICSVIGIVEFKCYFPSTYFVNSLLLGLTYSGYKPVAETCSLGLLCIVHVSAHARVCVCLLTCMRASCLLTWLCVYFLYVYGIRCTSLKMCIYPTNRNHYSYIFIMPKDTTEYDDDDHHDDVDNN